MTDKKNEKEIDVSGLGDEEELFIPGRTQNTYLPPLPSEGDEEAIDADKSPIRRWWDRYSYSAMRIYVTQFAMGIFGASLALATGKKLGSLSIASGIFSLLFFLILLHANAWEIGASDRISVDGGRRKKRLYMGALVGLLAGTPNFLVATVFALTYPNTVAAFMKVAAMFSEGMYWSIICNIPAIGGRLLHDHWWTYFLMALCTVLFVSISYILGYYNVGLPKVLQSRSVEEERAAMERRTSKKGKPKQK